MYDNVNLYKYKKNNYCFLLTKIVKLIDKLITYEIQIKNFKTSTLTTFSSIKIDTIIDDKYFMYVKLYGFPICGVFNPILLEAL